MNAFKKSLEGFYRRFVSLRGDPRRIAIGVAIGVFIGTTPTIPFHTTLVLAASALFRQHLSAAYLGSWFISNPLTIPVLYVTQYETGRILLGMERCTLVLPDYSLAAFASLGWQILLPLQVGGLLFAPAFAVPAYLVTRRLLAAWRAGKT
ncbi:MAG: DUF2062 domain-containing protein [Syntrophaceae bacterium]|nr:DUF2062 domain-containing protein [Syntrophaceae bacterium]